MEDQNYWEHEWLDPWGIFRAAIKGKWWASTIPQQLMTNVFKLKAWLATSSGNKIKRLVDKVAYKLRQIVLSKRLNSTFQKQVKKENPNLSNSEAKTEMKKKVLELLNEYRPDVLVITGHDAFYNRTDDKSDLNNYLNSNNFMLAIKEARKYERNQDKLIIVAGACQSNYEELIKAGANFASSPKRINIHALDPAIIASSVAFSDRNQSIDLINLIKKTKYGSDGIGGIITNGTMYVGFPRWILILLEKKLLVF